MAIPHVYCQKKIRNWLIPLPLHLKKIRIGWLPPSLGGWHNIWTAPKPWIANGLSQSKGLWTLTFLPRKLDHLQSQSWSHIKRVSCLGMAGKIKGNVSELITLHGYSLQSVNKQTKSTCNIKPSGEWYLSWCWQLTGRTPLRKFFLAKGQYLSLYFYINPYLGIRIDCASGRFAQPRVYKEAQYKTLVLPRITS